MSPPKGVFSPSKKEESPPKRAISPPKKEMSLPTAVLPLDKKETSGVFSPSKKDELPPKSVLSPPMKHSSLSREVVSPPTKEMSPPRISPPKKEFPLPISIPSYKRMGSNDENSVAARANMFESASSSPKEVTSPPVSAFKLKRTDSKVEEKSFPPPKPKREDSIGKEIPSLNELTIVSDNANKNEAEKLDSKIENNEAKTTNEESNGVGDKIKKFERAAEDASGTLGRVSRPGSVRGKSRTERLGSDEFPPPATPFKDNVHFELCPDKERQNILEKQPNVTKINVNKWQRSESEEKVLKPEPQKIIKPEFKPMEPSGEVTIRSPSLGASAPDQFPSHGTAFRNVASVEARNVHKPSDVNKQCKFKDKKYSVSKGSSYFTRGPEEIWLVKKKDIEEIEERVLDSFRRAGGNVCMRSESVRPSSDSGQGAFAATMGRTKRPMYARSESLDPQWAGARAQTLKRQTSVACTCGHDKKARAKSASPASDANARPRSRSHGDDSSQGHVLDKYETLV